MIPSWTLPFQVGKRPWCVRLRAQYRATCMLEDQFKPNRTPLPLVRFLLRVQHGQSGAHEEAVPKPSPPPHPGRRASRAHARTPPFRDPTRSILLQHQPPAAAVLAHGMREDHSPANRKAAKVIVLCPTASCCSRQLTPPKLEGESRAMNGTGTHRTHTPIRPSSPAFPS